MESSSITTGVTTRNDSPTMSPRPNPAAAARAAVAAAATAASKGVSLPQAIRNQVGTDDVKTDGRKRRWEGHKEARRTELVDGTLAAVRTLGADAGMDEIASEIGVSKTVLYRYFSDKSDLTTAAMMRFLETVLVPRLGSAINEDVGEFELTRMVISVYVQTVADEPHIYSFVMAGGSGTQVLADSQKLVAQMLTFVMINRMVDQGSQTAGVETWAYSLVGAIQLAVHWWMVEQRLGKDELIDYLTMMVWSSISGIAAAGGSPEYFNAQDHPLPQTPESTRQTD
ncbi:TetR/AcrR family transcriptional regulator [Williamsia limnetica]|uniref:TetR/AcrR family transcriptional regulator n=1 Tax=Williamsia limnetica TaxID=882452 RepID=UPI001FE8BCDC|nr:TetR/AcrR family transcriptional regulator [Williamsia limnetica]